MVDWFLLFSFVFRLVSCLVEFCKCVLRLVNVFSSWLWFCLSLRNFFGVIEEVCWGIVFSIWLRLMWVVLNFMLFWMINVFVLINFGWIVLRLVFFGSFLILNWRILIVFFSFVILGLSSWKGWMKVLLRRILIFGGSFSVFVLKKLIDSLKLFRFESSCDFFILMFWWNWLIWIKLISFFFCRVVSCFRMFFCSVRFFDVFWIWWSCWSKLR